ncbi:hypothetical protein MSHO_58230 [Mycobacterium shottsii]|uniref:Uncharacterized protein n=1 Tax=Mycobacterium shottsii TaxID=133549 RepID=A0A7I7LKV1_9MYCO|nr:hypothetical protein MSHO_58230 [Mycobacterium shottsii]
MSFLARIRDMDATAWRSATWSAPVVIQFCLLLLLAAMWLLGNWAFPTESGRSERTLLLTATALATLASLGAGAVLLNSSSSQRRGLPRACLLNVNGVLADAVWVMRTHAISDDLWSLIVAVLPAGRRRGRPWNDHRRTLEGIIWRYRT